MSATPNFVIDLNERFEHLNNAPIAEAAVGVQARAETLWEEAPISEAVKPLLPDYPKRHSLDGFQQEFSFSPGVAMTKPLNTAWNGLRFQTEDNLHIAQFNRNGFVFSRLRPYQEWDRLIREALRLWNIFVSVAKPTEINRIGLRFVNCIKLPREEIRLEDYLETLPKCPKDLDIPYQHFFFRESFVVPGHPYLINLTKTVQPENPFQPDSGGLIIDIDVSTTQPMPMDAEQMQRCLLEMRWLKNKVFFGTVTAKALEKFK